MAAGGGVPPRKTRFSSHEEQPHCLQWLFNHLHNGARAGTPQLVATHQGLLLLPQPLVVLHHLLLLLVQDLPHLQPLHLPELLRLLPAARTEEVFLLVCRDGGDGGPQGARVPHPSVLAQEPEPHSAHASHAPDPNSHEHPIWGALGFPARRGNYRLAPHFPPPHPSHPRSNSS